MTRPGGLEELKGQTMADRVVRVSLEFHARAIIYAPTFFRDFLFETDNPKSFSSLITDIRSFDW